MPLVLDKGSVELITSMASDLQVVAAARVSNGLEYSESSKGEDKDYKLLRYLISHRHGTPFEHTTFTFYVDCPLFVAREWHRHRIASYNEISRRYVDSEPKFYSPEHLRVPGTTNKQGSVTSDDIDLFHIMKSEIDQAARDGFYRYEYLIRKGVAKELARMVLPQSMYTQFYFTVNARSLMNFLSLRNAPDAQWEIRQYAVALEAIFEEKMPLTHKAFIENNRIAP